MNKRVATFVLTALPLLYGSAIADVGVSGSHSATVSPDTHQQIQSQRIISAGNGITELIYALGAGDQVVAVDITSNWPPETRNVPRLGYHRQLSAEGILAMKPTVLIGTEDMGPPATLTQLKNAGVKVVALPLKYSEEAIHQQIVSLGKLLDKEKEGKALWASVQSSFQKARALADSHENKPKVMFLLAMGGRSLSVSGSNTAADAMIELAGGINVAADQFASYKPLSKEALLQMAPEFIIYADRGDGLTPEQLLTMQPALRKTPAGRDGNVIALDGSLLLGGFGPRTGETAMRLAGMLYGKNKPGFVSQPKPMGKAKHGS
ncbi:heme/hemin ABC transporter substrate-binding protein [Candidatus Sororendozoicomonas aggregata]|uniref:heme/hemin ABC transporter substrate-binding protein n=1 Tax=Candidatus Sororendozoicomonas aggregata TaxID=3073239 RepID=UPI002ED578F7